MSGEGDDELTVRSKISSRGFFEDEAAGIGGCEGGMEGLLRGWDGDKKEWGEK